MAHVLVAILAAVLFNACTCDDCSNVTYARTSQALQVTPAELMPNASTQIEVRWPEGALLPGSAADATKLRLVLSGPNSTSQVASWQGSVRADGGTISNVRIVELNRFSFVLTTESLASGAYELRVKQDVDWCGGLSGSATLTVE